MFKNYAFIKLFKKNSLFWKYYKRTFFIIVLPFIMLFSVFYYYNTVNNNIKINSMCSQSFIKQKASLENKLSFIEHESYAYMADNSVIEMITAKNIYESKYLDTVIKMMKKTISLNGISSVTIYSSTGNYILSTRVSGFADDVAYKPWYDKFIRSGTSNFIIPAKSAENSHSDEMCISHGIYRNGNLLGILVLTYPVSSLFDYTPGNENLFIINNDNIVASTDEHILADNSRFWDFVHSDDEKYVLNNLYYFKCYIESFDSYFVSIFDKVNSGIGKTQIFIILLPLFAFILPFVLSFYLANKYYTSLAEILLSSINSNKNLEILSSDNELSFIKEYISANEKYVLHLEEELDDNTSKLKFAQTAALQMQFNPHFLFNTLNLINMQAICLTKSENDVSRTVSTLADILKTSLDTDNYMITVVEEMKLAKKYLYIEQLRYKDKFDVIWNIDAETKNIQIAKFTIQPIVENALKHGIHMLPPNTKGILKISSHLSDGYLNLTVSNNGYCSPKQFRQMQTIINDNDNIINASHIGLKNVNTRLKIFFGEKYFCSVTQSNGYTNITLHIPLK
mgnify:FL=1